MNHNKRIHVLGSYLDVLTMDETLLEVKRLIMTKQVTQHVVLNANKVMLMKIDPTLANIINQSSLINADGKSIIWAARFLGHDVKERVTGIDLFEAIIPVAAQAGFRIYYFGATEETVKKVVKKHQEQYPNLQVVGFRNGYFSEEESKQIAEDIRNSQADILFVAFPSPKKELWINRYLKVMNVPFVMGVGGSFDVIAGKTKRAPKWMQNAGLEWFYRLIQEPRRMFMRYLKGNIFLLVHVLKEKWQMRSERG